MGTVLMSPADTKRQQELASDIAKLERYLEACTNQKAYDAIKKLIYLLSVAMNRLEKEE